MSEYLNNFCCDVRNAIISNRLEETYIDDLIVLNYLSPCLIGSVELIDNVKDTTLNKKKLSDNEKKKICIINTMLCILRTTGKCIKNYLKQIELIASSGSDMLIFDKIANSIMNGVYLKFHLLIPKEIVFKVVTSAALIISRIIFIYLYKKMKLKKLNNLIIDDIPLLEILKEDSLYQQINQRKYLCNEIKMKNDLYQEIKKETKFEVINETNYLEKNKYDEYNISFENNLCNSKDINYNLDLNIGIDF
jgi:hypothetical protein